MRRESSIHIACSGSEQTMDDVVLRTSSAGSNNFGSALSVYCAISQETLLALTLDSSRKKESDRIVRKSLLPCDYAIVSFITINYSGTFTRPQLYETHFSLPCRFPYWNNRVLRTLRDE